MKKDCAAHLRGLVARDETIVAVGTAQELRTLDPDIGSGGGSTFIVVTEERALFAKWGSPQKPHEEIRINEVTHWGRGSQYNCHVVILTHPRMTRREPSPARRFLWLTWGRAEAERSRTQTIFRFSRPDTEVAKAIRAALEKRQVPHQLLRFEERSREDRTRGSHAVMTAKQT